MWVQTIHFLVLRFIFIYFHFRVCFRLRLWFCFRLLLWLCSWLRSWLSPWLWLRSWLCVQSCVVCVCISGCRFAAFDFIFVRVCCRSAFETAQSAQLRYNNKWASSCFEFTVCRDLVALRPDSDEVLDSTIDSQRQLAQRLVFVFDELSVVVCKRNSDRCLRRVECAFSTQFVVLLTVIDFGSCDELRHNVRQLEASRSVYEFVCKCLNFRLAVGLNDFELERDADLHFGERAFDPANFVLLEQIGAVWPWQTFRVPMHAIYKCTNFCNSDCSFHSSPYLNNWIYTLIYTI